jgi:hypothetical protein
MAITSVGTIGTANNRSKATLDIAVGTSIVPGSLVVVLATKANTAAADGVTNEVPSVTDTSANLWVKAAEYCNGDPGTLAGCVTAIWYCQVVTTISAGGKITIAFDAGFHSESAATSWQFTVSTAKTIAPILPAQTAATDASTAPSQVISGLTNAEYLFVRAEGAEETATGTFTVSGSFTKFTAAAETTGSGAAINGEFRILTGTTATSAPTGTSAGKDRSSIFVALHEVDSSNALALAWAF